MLGATAIEDRLQDGVPETIADLKEAGIKLWVATGDKLETAIGMHLHSGSTKSNNTRVASAIGHSTNLIGQDSNMIVIRGGAGRPVYDQIVHAIEEFFPDMNIFDAAGHAVQPNTTDHQIVVTGGRRQRVPSQHNEGGGPLRRMDTGISSIVGPDNGDRPGGFVLIIDGGALVEALADEESKVLLLRLAMLCEGVICCRVSPLQKALMVKLVKDGIHAMTLAIGDGANDVSMIQVRHCLSPLFT